MVFCYINFFYKQKTLVVCSKTKTNKEKSSFFMTIFSIQTETLKCFNTEIALETNHGCHRAFAKHERLKNFVFRYQYPSEFLFCEHLS